MAKILPDEIKTIEKHWVGKCKELIVENARLNQENQNLSTKVKSLQADAFQHLIFSHEPTIDRWVEISEENDRLISENNRLTAIISKITEALYGGNDDDDGIENQTEE